MSTVYPGGFDTFTKKVDREDLYMASHINDVQDPVVAIEHELGNDPKGSAADLKTRLAVRIADDGKLKQPQQLVTVGQTNADYTTIQAAIDAIGDAAANKQYSVLIYPGRYSEEVTLKAYVHLVGTDRETCQVYSYDDQITLTTSNNSTIRNLHIIGEVSGGFPTTNTIKVDGVSTYVYNCIIESLSADYFKDTLYIRNGGTITLDHCRFLNPHINSDDGNCVLMFCTMQGDSATRSVMNLNNGSDCKIYSSVLTFSNPSYGINLSGSNAEIYNTYFEITSDTPINLGTGSTLKAHHSSFISAGDMVLRLWNAGAHSIRNCVLIGGGALPVIEVSSGNGPSIYGCTLLNIGSATYCITGSGNCAVAHIVSNLSLDPSLTNLIGTPYNVIDSDVS